MKYDTKEQPAVSKQRSRGPLSTEVAVLGALDPDVMARFLVEYLKNANLLSPAQSGSPAPLIELQSNGAFWQSVLGGQTRPHHWVGLPRFHVVDWFPRSPGLYHTPGARQHRQTAQQDRHEENGIVFYELMGKRNMIEGGLGSVRFKPKMIEGELCWLATATSDGQCHTGIPVAIPDRLWYQVDSNPGNCFSLKGQLRFLPEFLEGHFPFLTRVPQIYVLVSKIVPCDGDWQPIWITPLVFFYAHQERLVYRRGLVTYATCIANDQGTINRAADWIQEYVDRHDGYILTNFDEQWPAFADVPLSLHKVMTGRPETEWVYREPDPFPGEMVIDAAQRAEKVAGNQGQRATDDFDSARQHYDFARIGQLLRAAFTAEDLKRFCHDRDLFRPAIDWFPANGGLTDWVDALITYCEKRDLLDRLLAEVEEENPRQYTNFGPYAASA